MNATLSKINLSTGLIFCSFKDSKEACLLDPKTMGTISTFAEDAKYDKNGIVFSDVYQTLITQSSTKSLLSFWNISDNKAFMKCGTFEKINCLILSKNNEICIGGGNNGFVYVWLINTGKLLGKFKASNKSIRQIYLFNNDKKMVLSLYDSKLYLWDIEDIIIKFCDGRNELVDNIGPYKVMEVNNSQ